MKHTDPLERIANLTDFERRSALCYLAGYAPAALASALDEMDRQREVFHQHRSALQNWNAGIEAKPEPAQWFDTEAAADLAENKDGPAEGIDFQITKDESHYDDEHAGSMTRYLGTCLACGSETPWQITREAAATMMSAHVAAEWMSH
jgi:hypothetical protein